MSPDERYLHRCFQLARLGAGSVSPNPLVGAVLVHEGRIIGEGWHRQFGAAHAEVNALATVAPEDRHLIPQATLYCSLEPCSHQGKTPPCADLIVREKIARVVVSNTDPNPLVAGQGLEKLRAAGIRVEAGVLQREGYELNRPFFTWITQKRPYIILKWAESADGFLGRIGQRTSVSGPLAQRLVHRWRSEADAILVGAVTARVDNPRLDNRLYFGKSPLRIALDFRGQMPAEAHLLDDSAPTWILGPPRPGNWQHTRFLPIGNSGETSKDWMPALLEQLRAAQRAILLVEGGASVLQQFIDAGLGDEIRILESPQRLGSGVPAPRLGDAFILEKTEMVGSERLRVRWQ